MALALASLRRGVFLVLQAQFGLVLSAGGRDGKIVPLGSRDDGSPRGSYRCDYGRAHE